MNEGIILRSRCPICNSTSSKSIFNRSFKEELIKEYMNVGYQGNADIGFLEEAMFEIVKCNSCNLSYQKYVLDERRLNDLYNKWIDPQLAHEWNETGKIGNKRLYTFILKFAEKQLKRESSRIKILDYGAGFGDSLLLARSMGFDSYAYEYSTERIHILEEKGIKTIDDKNEMLFDFIIVNQIFEHLTYPDEILKIIITKLNKNGLIYLAVPNCIHIEKKLEKTENMTDAKKLQQALLDTSVGAFQHINFFTNYTLKLFFKEHKLKPIYPFKQALVKPLNIKSFILPFYKYYFGTSFFLIKARSVQNKLN